MNYIIELLLKCFFVLVFLVTAVMLHDFGGLAYDKIIITFLACIMVELFVIQSRLGI